MTTEKSEEFVAIQSQWAVDPGAVPAPVNNILIQAAMNVSGADGAQAGVDGIYLTLGHLMAPMVQPPEGTILPIVPLGSYFMSRARLAEFHRVIGEFLVGTEPEK
jgi:hypothetical protein